jgi:hypothetical protein
LSVKAVGDRNADDDRHAKYQCRKRAQLSHD